MASSGSDDASIAPRNKYRDGCVQVAIAAGLYHGGIGFLVGTVATLALNATWRPFRALNASAKTAIVRNFTVRGKSTFPLVLFVSVEVTIC
jgi:hypothetical protein